MRGSGRGYGGESGRGSGRESGRGSARGSGGEESGRGSGRECVRASGNESDDRGSTSLCHRAASREALHKALKPGRSREEEVFQAKKFFIDAEVVLCACTTGHASHGIVLELDVRQHRRWKSTQSLRSTRGKF